MAQESKPVWFITGCSTGFGRALARYTLDRGYRVVVTARNPADVEDLAAGNPGRALVLALDVTKPAQIAACVDAAEAKFGRIDVLVNNAGVFRIVGMTATSLDEYMRIVTINQVGTFLGMKAVTETMIGQGSGSIVNISSIAGLTGSAGTIAYTASKFAVRGMTKVAAVELAPFGVRVNSVHPGLIDTPMLRDVFGPGENAILEAARKVVPNGRLASA
jgi:3alpha(or 20beta)-hydroxysteroid dehydrogenase